jgi:folate-dependent phosphoribosylglycinamide formyltransferase PurN
MRTLLMCHDGAELHRDGLARWLAANSDLVGVVVLHEGGSTLWKRVRRQLKRAGALRFLDVLAFRLYYKLFLGARDEAWKRERLAQLQARYPEVPVNTPVAHFTNPNSAECERFIREQRPDVMLALCKQLLKRNVFSAPTAGTFVLHPGICPEYRNAHGCFWALATGDVDKVGMTLLRIDEGVDTGPVYGYFTYDYDEVNESHVVIQNRVTLDNLDAVWRALQAVWRGEATPIDTRGRESATWGQPWLTSYARWKVNARRRRRASHRAAVP